MRSAGVISLGGGLSEEPHLRRLRLIVQRREQGNQTGRPCAGRFSVVACPIESDIGHPRRTGRIHVSWRCRIVRGVAEFSGLALLVPG
jgi:hypothetical protein